MVTWKSFIECFDDVTDTTIQIGSYVKLLAKFDRLLKTPVDN